MAENKTPSPVQKARERMKEGDRRQARLLSELIPEKGQGRMKEEDAKLIAAALMEMMKR